MVVIQGWVSGVAVTVVRSGQGLDAFETQQLLGFADRLEEKHS